MLVSRVYIQIAFCGFKRVSMGKKENIVEGFLVVYIYSQTAIVVDGISVSTFHSQKAIIADENLAIYKDKKPQLWEETYGGNCMHAFEISAKKRDIYFRFL